MVHINPNPISQSTSLMFAVDSEGQSCTVQQDMQSIELRKLLGLQTAGDPLPGELCLMSKRCA